MECLPFIQRTYYLKMRSDAKDGNKQLISAFEKSVILPETAAIRKKEVMKC